MSTGVRDTCSVCILSEGGYMCRLLCKHTIHAECLSEIVQTGDAHPRCPNCGTRLGQSTKIDFGDGKYWKINTNELLRNFHDRGTMVFNVTDPSPSTTTVDVRSEREIYPYESISVAHLRPHGESRQTISRKPVPDPGRHVSNTATEDNAHLARRSNAKPALLHGRPLARSNVEHLEACERFETAMTGISAWLEHSEISHTNIPHPDPSDHSTRSASTPVKQFATPATSIQTSKSRSTGFRAILKTAGRDLLHELCKPLDSEIRDCSSLDRAATAHQELMCGMTKVRESGNTQRTPLRSMGPSRLVVSTITMDADTGEVVKYKMERKGHTVDR